MTTKDEMNVRVGYGCLILLLNLLLGGWSVDYLLQFLGKNIHWIGDVLIGLVIGQFTIPIALVIWLLQLFGGI